MFIENTNLGARSDLLQIACGSNRFLSAWKRSKNIASAQKTLPSLVTVFAHLCHKVK